MLRLGVKWKAWAGDEGLQAGGRRCGTPTSHSHHLFWFYTTHFSQESVDSDPFRRKIADSRTLSEAFLRRVCPPESGGRPPSPSFQAFLCLLFCCSNTADSSCWKVRHHHLVTKCASSFMFRPLGGRTSAGCQPLRRVYISKPLYCAFLSFVHFASGEFSSLLQWMLCFFPEATTRSSRTKRFCFVLWNKYKADGLFGLSKISGFGFSTEISPNPMFDQL